MPGGAKTADRNLGRQMGEADNQRMSESMFLLYLTNARMPASAKNRNDILKTDTFYSGNNPLKHARNHCKILGTPFWGPVQTNRTR